MEEAFEHVVGALDQTDSSARRGRESDDVTPQGRTMTVEVAEDEVDGLTRVLSRTALWTPLLQRRLQILDGVLDVAELDGLLRCVEGGALVRWRLDLEPEGVTELIEEARAGIEDPGWSLERQLATHGREVATKALERLLCPQVGVRVAE
jgi:hypothetical protein